MKPIPKSERSTFKMMLAYLKSGKPAIPSMQRFAERYAIDLVELQERLMKEDGGLEVEQMLMRAGLL